MASVKKFNRHDAINIIRHNERSIKHSSNLDIDQSRTHLNYSLLDRGMSDREYYLQRLGEVHCLNRTDVNTLCCWVVTAPRDLAEEDHKRFFETVVDFIGERYGRENLCSAWVHRDEENSHVHIGFLPVVYDEVHEREKICANDVITRLDLRTFHPQLQTYLEEHGLEVRVQTGITAEQGGNRTVAELKRERELKRELEREVGLQRDDLRDIESVVSEKEVSAELWEDRRNVPDHDLVQEVSADADGATAGDDVCGRDQTDEGWIQEQRALWESELESDRDRNLDVAFDHDLTHDF